MSKRWASVAAVVVLTLGATGCGDNDGDQAQTEVGAGTAAATTAATDTTSTDGARTAPAPAPSDGGAGKAKQAEDAPARAPKRTSGSRRSKVPASQLAWGRELGDGSIQRFGRAASPAEAGPAWSAARTYVVARGADEWQRACGVLSKRVTDEFEQLARQAKGLEDTSCAGMLKMLSTAGPAELRRREAQDMRLVEFRVDGDGGFVLFESAGLRHGFLPMSREGGRWKAGSIAPMDLTRI